MKKIYSLILLTVIIFAAAQAQKVVTVSVSSNVYTPQDITVNVGDTILFQWVGGSHPTKSDENLWTTFTSNPNNQRVKIPVTSNFSVGKHIYWCTSHATSASVYPAQMTGSVTVSGTAAIEAKSVKTEFQVYPNPVTDKKININYSIAKDQSVVVKLMDVLGNEVAILANDRKSAGDHKLSLELEETIRSGLYFVRMTIGNEVLTKRISIQ